MFTSRVRAKILVYTESLLNCSQQSRCLSRWVGRKPIKVISSEEYDEETDSQITNTSIQPEWNKSYFKNKSLQREMATEAKPLTIAKRNVAPKITMDMLELTVDDQGNFLYSKMKNNDTRITTLLTDIKSNKNKEKRELILLEGKRLIKDALDAKCKLKYIIFSRFNELDYLKSSLPRVGAKLYKMPYKEIQMWSNLTTSPGIMGIFQIPSESPIALKDALPLTVICDNIREADNLGAILRSSSGVGCEQVLLTKGCVNVWDSKVTRSACGAHFKLNIKNKFDLETIEEVLPAEYNIFIADNKTISSTGLDKEYNDKEDLSNLVKSVPLLPYYGLNFNLNKHNVLIVGGETEGISEKSYRLVSNLKGVRLNIPLGNNVDSLNVGTAFGIIVFEMKRQYLMSKVNTTVSSKTEECEEQPLKLCG